MTQRSYLFTLVAVALLASACATSEPQTAEKREALHSQAQSAIQSMTAKDPDLQNFINNGYAYAIYPSVGKGGAIVGGAFGRGEVYQQGARVGWSELQQANIGAQLGGQTYRELIVFQNAAAFDRFKNGKLEFSADASAVAMESGKSKSAKFNDGVAVFTMPTKGLMVEASVGGQKFTFHPAGSEDRMTAGPTTRSSE